MNEVSLDFNYHSGNQSIGIIHIAGMIDLSNAARLSEFLESALTHPCRVLVFDLKGLRYMNSTGLGTLWKALDESESRKILFANLEKNIQDIFNLMGLNQVFEILPNMSVAIEMAEGLLGGKKVSTHSPSQPQQEDKKSPALTSSSSPQILQAKALSSKDLSFPVVHACPECKKMVNFRKPGHYKCPHCDVIHYLTEEGEISIISNPLAPSLPSVPKAVEAPDLIEITLPSDPHHLSKIRDFILSFTKENFSDEDCANLAMAVDEACGNAIEHAHKFDRLKKIYMSIYIDPKKFSITIADSGENTFREELLNRKLNDVKKTGRGMGFYLMKQMMDEVRLERTQRGGTAITLVKYAGKD